MVQRYNSARRQYKLHQRYIAEKVGGPVEETYNHFIQSTPIPIVQDRYIAMQQASYHETDITEEDYFMPENAFDSPLSVLPEPDIPDDLLEIRDSSIDLENIMEKIRRQVGQRRKELGYEKHTFPDFELIIYPVKSDDLPADVELQNHLQAVSNIYNLAETTPLLLPSPTTQIPIIGGLWKQIRKSAHELVLFYVNRYIRHQTSVNHHLVNGVNELVKLSLEQQQQITALQRELEQLRADTNGDN